MINIQNRTDFLRGRISEMKAFLKSAPSGSLVCKPRSSGKYSYYRSEHEKQEYLSKSQVALMRELALKKLFKKTLVSAEKEVSALKKLAACQGRYEKDTAKVFADNPGLVPLLITGPGHNESSQIEAKVSSWQQEEYSRNNYYPEYLIHETLKGEKVRSKSEASIADVLYLAGLPYRYECELILGRESFYPDFEIMDPSTGEIKIWEHFGLMDLEKYSQRTSHKISSYIANGYYPNINFIITCETSGSPFTAVQASEIVSFFFHREIQPRF